MSRLSRSVAAWFAPLAAAWPGGSFGPGGCFVVRFSGAGALPAAAALGRSAAAAGLVAVVLPASALPGSGSGRVLVVAPAWSALRRRAVLAALGLPAGRRLAFRCAWLSASPAGGWFGLVPAGRLAAGARVA